MKCISDRKTRLLEKIDHTYPKVETELFNAGLTNVQRKTHFPLVIFKGSQNGCEFAAKMLFRRVISSRSNIDSYIMTEAEELSILNTKREAIVLVLGANGGGTGNKRKRLDDWFEILKEWMPIGSQEHGKLTLILTLNDRSKIKHPILYRYSEYILDANGYPPSNETKVQLVNALMKQNSVTATSLRNEPLHSRAVKEGKLHFIDKDIINDLVPYLSSKGCIGELSEFFNGHLFEGLHFFRKPTPSYVKEMRTLCKKGSLSFLALLAVHALGGLHIENKDSSSSQQQSGDSFEKKWRSMISINKLSEAKSLGKLYNGIDIQFIYRFAKEHGHQCNLGSSMRKAAYGLVGKFLDKIGEVFKFSNGRVYYSFLLVLYEAYPKGLENCDSDFFFNYIKLHNSVYDENPDTCILIDDRKLDEKTRSVCCRFKHEIMLKRVAKCMKHPAMSPQFFKLFLKYLNETPHLTWKVLKQTDADPNEAHSSLYHGMLEIKLDHGSSYKNITELIICHKIWKRKRGSTKWKEWTALQERETLIRATEVSNIQTFRLLLDAGAEISLPAIKNAINNGSEEIIEMIMKNWSVDKREFIFEAAKYAADKLSEENLTPGLVRLLKNLISNSNSMSLATLPTMDKPPLLHWIIKENKTVVLRRLLEEEMIVDVNTMFDEETPLLAAIRYGHQNIVHILLQHNVVIGQREFAMAASQGNVSVLEHLFKKRPATFVEEDEDGLTPLYYAVSNGQLEAVKFILSKPRSRMHSNQINERRMQMEIKDSSKFDQDLQTMNIKGQTALHVAATNGYSQIIEVLVNEGFDICTKDRFGDTPMSLAYRNHHMHALRCILGIWKSKLLPLDENVIQQVVRNGDMDCLSLMNEYGFQINCESSTYEVIIMECIEKRMHDMVRCILSNGGNASKTIDGWRLIHFAARNADLVMLKILIEFRADMISKTDSHGDSIIHIGVQQNNVEFVESVFGMPDSSDLIDMKNFVGNTALHVASKLGCPSLLEILLEVGFKTEIPNKDGLRPLAIVEQEVQSAITYKNKRWKQFVECKDLLEKHRQLLKLQ